MQLFPLFYKPYINISIGIGNTHYVFCVPRYVYNINSF